MRLGKYIGQNTNLTCSLAKKAISLGQYRISTITLDVQLGDSLTKDKIVSMN